MKVFISWSGDKSKELARLLHDWLPTVVQYVRPYMSAESIEKGARWSVDLAQQLEDTAFGIICATHDNLSAPWIMFEAGALSKSLAKGRVSPLLFGVKPSDLRDSPLIQFQATEFTRDDTWKILSSINGSAPDAERLATNVLERAFSRAWQELDDGVGRILGAYPAIKPPGDSKETPDEQMRMMIILEELLSNSRGQAKAHPAIVNDLQSRIAALERERRALLDDMVRVTNSMARYEEHAARTSEVSQRMLVLIDRAKAQMNDMWISLDKTIPAESPDHQRFNSLIAATKPEFDILLQILVGLEELSSSNYAPRPFGLKGARERAIQRAARALIAVDHNEKAPEPSLSINDDDDPPPQFPS